MLLRSVSISFAVVSNNKNLSMLREKLIAMMTTSTYLAPRIARIGFDFLRCATAATAAASTVVGGCSSFWASTGNGAVGGTGFGGGAIAVPDPRSSSVGTGFVSVPLCACAGILLSPGTTGVRFAGPGPGHSGHRRRRRFGWEDHPRGLDLPVQGGEEPARGIPGGEGRGGSDPALGGGGIPAALGPGGRR